MHITLKSVQTDILEEENNCDPHLLPFLDYLPSTEEEIGSGDTNSQCITILPYSIHNKMYLVWVFSLVKIESVLGPLIADRQPHTVLLTM